MSRRAAHGEGLCFGYALIDDDAQIHEYVVLEDGVEVPGGATVGD